MNTSVNDGGPAFPRAAFTPGEGHDHFSSGGFTSYQQEGMSLRDWFAGMTISGMPRSSGLTTAAERATSAYEQADAMLAARAAKPGEKEAK